MTGNRLVRLDEVASVFNGKTPSRVQQRLGGHPVLKIRDVTALGVFRGRFESFVDSTLAEKHRDRWVKAGDTLILNAAHNADYVASKTFFAGSAVEGSLATGEWLLIRAKGPDLLPEYLNYWCRAPNTRRAIRFLVKGIHLYPKDVATLSIEPPPIEYQRRVIDILSRAEGIVRLRREAQAKAQAIIPALFLDMFGDPATNPKGWPVVPLSGVAEVISGVAKGRKLAPGKGVELPYMRVANVKDGYLDLAEIKTIEIKQTEVEKLLIRHGDLLMTEGGDPDKLGRAALWSGEIESCVHQNHIFKVRSERSRILPTYLRALAGSAYGKAYFLSVAKKTTGIASINKTQLCAFPVVLPPIDSQASFDTQVASIESIAALQISAAERAEAMFMALLSRTFSSDTAAAA